MKNVFHIWIVIDILPLLTGYEYIEIDELVRIVFWSIYNMLILEGFLL